MRRDWSIAILLAGITLALYWPVHGFDLIYFDDTAILNDSPAMQAGLTWDGLKWAFTSVVIANWHPVTNLSFLAVSQFFGNTPSAQHLANAFIHAANAALLCLMLCRLTGATWRSAAVAAIFAWHPLRVESVAWIAERKDVLCAFFFLLSLWAYAGFAKEAKAQSRKSKVFYGASLLAFALALLSKPMAVTLPFVLLLLDGWPLNRMTWDERRGSVAKALLVEKIPFFSLMILFSVTTYWIQHDYAAMMPWEQLGLAPRVANAISGYVTYPAQLFWPVNLAVTYPLPKSHDLTETILQAALLLAVSAGCIAQIKNRPQLAMGWCWYLGTALPVIGIIQVGAQAMADRYTYLPLIGPIVALVWTSAEICPRRAGGKIILATATFLILGTLLVLSARQLQCWRNTVTLFSHNVAVTPDNGNAYFMLGLGWEHAGDMKRAITCYQAAKDLAPVDPQIRRNLASLLAKQSQWGAAQNEYTQLLALNADDASTHAALAGVLAAQGREEESFAELNTAVALDHESAEALNNLAWELATSSRAALRDGPRAVLLAEKACALTKPMKTIFLGTLGAAYAEAGRFDDAVVSAQCACDLAAKNGETDLAQKNRELLALYRQHKAYHQGQK